MSRNTYLRRPHAAASGYSARDVARAYGCPVDSATGAGVTVGVIELGGGLNAADLTAMGLDPTTVTVVGVAGGSPQSDGPDGADGEVALDVEVIGLVAPGAKQRVYFSPNTDAGFLAAINQAVGDGCQVITISWGGPESSWSPSTVKAFAAAFAAAKAKGVTVFAASGDAGSRDGTRQNVADYPASDPSVVGCGGTRLVLDASGSRASEVVWNDNPTNDATGGGVSGFFPGRTVPDVAGNADPVTGYKVVVDGQSGVIGGTSAVAPLYAGMCAVLIQLLGRPFDLLATIAANPSICFDVTVGNNGGYKAGPGKDDVSGWGVVDFGKLYAVLSGTVASPPPVTTPPAGGVDTDPADVALAALLKQLATVSAAWLTEHGFN
jgi:kumamolisin